MESLPIEILEKISINLTAVELAMCSAVCRKWRELFNSDSLWKPRCDITLEETLRTTPCVVEPPFVSPEVESSTLAPIGQWKLAFMRENHLWNNWRRGNHRIASVPVDTICHTYFISNYLIVRVFDTVSNFVKKDSVPTVKLFDLKNFPPTLLNETVNEDGGFLNRSVKPPHYVDIQSNTFILFYEEYSVAFTLDLNIENSMSFKYKICLPILESSEGSETSPVFRATRYAVLGYNTNTYTSSETLHIWNLEEGTELKVEKSPQDKPYGFTDVITSKTSDNAVIVVSNDVNCESFMLCAHFEPWEDITITYSFRIYNSLELRFLPFEEVFEAEHRIRYRCQIHSNYVAIAMNGFLKVYNYQSHDLLTEVPITIKKLSNTLVTTFLDVINDCFAFISDHNFKMFHPESQTFVVLVELQIKEFSVISNTVVEMIKIEGPKEIWKIGRHYQERLGVDCCSEEKTNESFTRVLKEDPNLDWRNEFKDENNKGMFGSIAASIKGIYNCPTLTEWFYYW